jgi:membrane protein implicated in regulation of membrane protease activity
MTVESVVAGGSSKVRLVDASVKELNIYGNAALFVGWDLPLFGPVAFSPALAFVIQLVALNLLAVTIIVLSFVVLRKLRKRRLNETKVLNKVKSHEESSGNVSCVIARSFLIGT